MKTFIPKRQISHRALANEGRIVIPKDIREHLDINFGDVLEIERKGHVIEIRKVGQDHCHFCEGKGIV